MHLPVNNNILIYIVFAFVINYVYIHFGVVNFIFSRKFISDKTQYSTNDHPLWISNNGSISSNNSDLKQPQIPLYISDALRAVEDPVFVVYGNSGYRHIMGNFICNMALFPGMHSHILVVVTDEDTAAFLRAFSERITVFVSAQDLHDSYDFESPGYLKLMLARGLVLVDLLGAAQAQSKTLVWLEPDFYYTQNLLSRPEMTETTSDLVFYWDHEMYCGCFIRFSPAPASLRFYKEVMDRMQRIHSVGGTTNDQILLNMVVAEQLPNHTLFDRCLYRSGTFKTGGYMLEYQRACQGILPVAQHHNWIVGASSKVRMAKESGGWFVSEDERSCRQRDLLLVVMTMSRVRSLQRLVNSLDTALYLPGSTVDLRVTVDRNYDNEVDAATKEYLDSLQWSHGVYEVVVWPRKVGLYGQWVHAWPAELYPESLYKAVVLLEDDLEVSPHYAKWFVGAHQAYGGINGVGAITGQRPNLVAAVNGPASVAGQVPGGVKAFGYLLMATWSLSPKHSVWREFRQWVLDKRAGSPDFVPLVPGIVPNQWYEQFKSRGEEENMWEMWFIRFTDERKLHTVYPWVEGGGKTIVGNWMEAGLHFSGAPSLDFPIAGEWDADLLMQTPLPFVGYELNFNGFCVIGDLYGQFNNQLLTVNWAAMLAKQLNLLLFLTYDNAPEGDYLKNNWERIFGAAVGISWVGNSFNGCRHQIRWKEAFADMSSRRWSVQDGEWPIIMPVQSIRSQAAETWLRAFPDIKRRITVHGRSFEGSSGHCMSSEHAAVKCSENLCDYRQPEVWKRFSSYFNNSFDMVLFSDGQNQAFVQTYQHIENESPLEVQMWMMVISNIHVGHPGSSQDYVVWRWRKQIKSDGFMLPWDCYNEVRLLK